MSDKVLIVAAESAASASADVARSLDFTPVIATTEDEAIRLLESQTFSLIAVTAASATRMRLEAAKAQPLTRVLELPEGNGTAVTEAIRALMIRYLAAGSRELDEAAPVDAGKVLGAGLALAALGLLAPAAFGGRIGQSYDISVDFGAFEAVRTPLGELAIMGSPHLVTSVFFDVGVYLVVVGLVLDILRSLGAEVDRHIEAAGEAGGGLRVDREGERT